MTQYEPEPAQEPDGFKIAAEQNISSARRAARTALRKSPQEQALAAHHRNMMNAAHNGVLATFEALHVAVQKSVVNWPDPDPASHGQNALMEAAGGGHVEIVKHLLSIGADVSLGDDQGQAAISCAAGKGKIGAMIALLDAGANVNHCSTAGWTPLMEAVMNGQSAAVTLLLERGADTHTPTPYGENIKAKARAMRYENIALLIEAAEKTRGAAVAAEMMKKGTAASITVSKPFKFKR